MRPDFSKIEYRLRPQNADPAGPARRLAGVEDGRAHPGQGVVHGRRSVRHGAPGLCGGRGAVPARAVLHDVRHAAVDHPPVRRLLHRGRIERLLPAQSGGRAEGPLGGVRPGDAPRLRFGQRARVGRCRQGRRGHRFGRGHEDSLRPDPARTDVGLDDHERRGAADHGVLHCGRRRAGRGHQRPERHHSERHSERVHGPQHVHLSAGAFHADHRRHFPVLLGEDAEVQLHFDQRLPHAGSRARAPISNSATRWPTAWNTSAPGSRRASISTPSRRASASSGASA